MSYDRNPLYDLASDGSTGEDEKPADVRDRDPRAPVHTRPVGAVSRQSGRPRQSLRTHLCWGVALTVMMWVPYAAMCYYGVLKPGFGGLFLLIAWVLAILAPKP